MRYVALHVGAWIETCKSVKDDGILPSRSTWARGLKPAIGGVNVPKRCRAPRGRVD